jgi:hypothetical protein
MRLKVDDLHAHLETLDRYGLPGLSSAMTDGVRALARGVRCAVLSVAAGSSDVILRLVKTEARQGVSPSASP